MTRRPVAPGELRPRVVGSRTARSGRCARCRVVQPEQKFKRKVRAAFTRPTQPRTGTVRRSVPGSGGPIRRPSPAAYAILPALLVTALLSGCVGRDACVLLSGDGVSPPDFVGGERVSSKGGGDVLTCTMAPAGRDDE